VGVPVWKHEAISHASRTGGDHVCDGLGVEARAQMADRGGYDIRLEAAAAKEWNSVRAWK